MLSLHSDPEQLLEPLCAYVRKYSNGIEAGSLQTSRRIPMHSLTGELCAVISCNVMYCVLFNVVLVVTFCLWPVCSDFVGLVFCYVICLIADLLS